MALTDFSRASRQKRMAWALEAFEFARNNAFISKFAGTSPNSMIQKITELTEKNGVPQCVVRLIQHLTEDGVVQDNTLEDNEEALQYGEAIIQVGQIRLGVRNKGKMTKMETVDIFRKDGREQLGYRMADVLDQLAFQTLSGLAYTLAPNMAARSAKSQLSILPFAADVSAPTDNRHYRWDAGTSTIVKVSADPLSNLATADTPTYKMLLQAKAKFTSQYMRKIKAGANSDLIHVFMSPEGLVKLKLDTDYLANIRNAGVRGAENELFKGTNSVLVDGMMIHEFNHVVTTTGAASGSKWGAGGAVDGQRVLFCGAQALAMGDLGEPDWVEKEFDYDNQNGISISKVGGFLKPKFTSNLTNTVEDFSVLVVDTAI